MFGSRLTTMKDVSALSYILLLAARGNGTGTQKLTFTLAVDSRDINEPSRITFRALIVDCRRRVCSRQKRLLNISCWNLFQVIHNLVIKFSTLYKKMRTLSEWILLGCLVPLSTSTRCKRKNGSDRWLYQKIYCTALGRGLFDNVNSCTISFFTSSPCR